MADERAANGKDVDPLAAFRELRDTYLDAWSKTMVDAVNTEAYAQASGTMLNTISRLLLLFAKPWRRPMLQALQQLNMPSHAILLAWRSALPMSK